MLCIQNVTIIKPDHLIPDGTILTEGNKIIYVGKHCQSPDEANMIDGQGFYAGPGLIDTHAHAGGGVMFQDDYAWAARFHLSHGTTSIFPTLYFTLSKEVLIEKIRYLKQGAANPDGQVIRGLYIEGPYLNGNFGTNRLQNEWTQPISRDDYLPVIEEAGDFVRLWACAPERVNIEQFVRDAKKKYPGVLFSVAHSEATPDQIEKLMPYGLRVGTHHTNATGTVQSFPECRGVCVDEAVNYNNEIYAELICDEKGIHVDPYLLRLILKIKGRERIILITDAFVDDGPPIPGCEDVTDINFDNHGEISGTKLTLNAACRNMMIHTGASLCDVFCFASLNPARLFGLEGRGEIKEEGIADIILIDAWMNVKKIIFGGKII